MDAPMIRNLCATGANTYVWNRNAATTKEFAKEQKNITVRQTLAQVAMHCDTANLWLQTQMPSKVWYLVNAGLQRLVCKTAS